MATTQLNQEAIAAAKALHPRLLRLFTRWTPKQLQLSSLSAETTTAIESTTTRTKSIKFEMKSACFEPSKTNPFMAWRNPNTGNWHQAHYGLRRQAEMFKLAKQAGVMELMPLSPKHPEIKEQRRLEGKKVKGTGVGQKVKGHKWERALGTKLDARRKAMAAMPELIKQWKQSGHGRGWKKYPGK